jgi:tRNA(adenine34) deaminase
MSESFSQKELQHFMQAALAEATTASEKNEVPIGAVLVCMKEKKIISAGHNLTESLNDPTAHAEVLAIRKASEIKKNWRLDKTALFITAEPCTMCAGTILQSRISSVIFGCMEPATGAVGSCYDLLSSKNVRVIQGILEEESRNILQNFFKARRQ